jgi:hypothetical protein
LCVFRNGNIFFNIAISAYQVYDRIIGHTNAALIPGNPAATRRESNFACKTVVSLAGWAMTNVANKIERKESVDFFIYGN